MFFCRISHSKITSRWLYARIFRATAVSEILPIKQGLKLNKALLEELQKQSLRDTSNKTRIETCKEIKKAGKNPKSQRYFQ